MSVASWASPVTRVEIRIETLALSGVQVAERLSRGFEHRDVSRPWIGLSGAWGVVIRFAVDDGVPVATAVERVLATIEHVFHDAGLYHAAVMRLTGVELVETGSAHPEPWSWETHLQSRVDRDELTSVLRWGNAARLWKALAGDVEEAVRRAEAAARLDEALSRLR